MGCEGQSFLLLRQAKEGLLSTLTHVSLNPLVHEALHMHISNSILQDEWEQ